MTNDDNTQEGIHSRRTVRARERGSRAIKATRQQKEGQERKDALVNSIFLAYTSPERSLNSRSICSCVTNAHTSENAHESHERKD